VTASFFALERMPETLLASLASQTRLTVDPSGDKPLLAAGVLAARGRGGAVGDARAFLASLGGEAGRVTRFADLRGALPRRPRFLLRTVEELRGDDARDEEGEQDEPVEWIRDDECVVGGQKEHVEDDERRRCRCEPEHSAASRARSENDKEQNQRDMYLLEHRADSQHAQGAQRQSRGRYQNRPNSTGPHFAFVHDT